MFYLLMWAKQSRCYHNRERCVTFFLLCSVSCAFVNAGDHIWLVLNVEITNKLVIPT